MIFFISNNKIILKKINGVTPIFFNPWGFSKLSIENQVQEALFQHLIENDAEILFYIENLFFGNRSKIALNKLKSVYPKNNIIEILDFEDLQLFFNQSSV